MNGVSVTKFTKIRPDLVRIEDGAGNVMALLTTQQEPTLFEETPAQDTSLIRQRLQEIIERHQPEEGNKPSLCGLCTDDGVSNSSWPCDAYTAVHIGLAALDGLSQESG